MAHTVQRGDKPITEAWAAVRAHAERLKPVHLRELFSADGGRFGCLCFREDDLTVDLSKEKLDGDALAALLDLARAVGVETLREAMAAGESINVTEGRAVLHIALRGGAEAPADASNVGLVARIRELGR